MAFLPVSQHSIWKIIVPLLDIWELKKCSSVRHLEFHSLLCSLHPDISQLMAEEGEWREAQNVGGWKWRKSPRKGRRWLYNLRSTCQPTYILCITHYTTYMSLLTYILYFTYYTTYVPSCPNPIEMCTFRTTIQLVLPQRSMSDIWAEARWIYREFRV